MKKLVSFLLCIALLMSASSDVIAAEKCVSCKQNDIKKQNEINIVKYVNSFIDSICNENDVVAGEVITILNEDDEISGYCIDVMKNTKNNGYVVVKFSNNEPIVSEFCIESNVTNPYKEIIEDADIEGDDLVYYSIGSNEYQVYDTQNEVVFTFGDEIVESKEFDEYKTQIQEYKIEKENQSVMMISDETEEHINYSSLDGWSFALSK